MSGRLRTTFIWLREPLFMCFYSPEYRCLLNLLWCQYEKLLAGLQARIYGPCFSHLTVSGIQRPPQRCFCRRPPSPSICPLNAGRVWGSCGQAGSAASRDPTAWCSRDPHGVETRPWSSNARHSGHVWRPCLARAAAPPEYPSPSKAQELNPASHTGRLRQCQSRAQGGAQASQHTAAPAPTEKTRFPWPAQLRERVRAQAAATVWPLWEEQRQEVPNPATYQARREQGSAGGLPRLTCPVTGGKTPAPARSDTAQCRQRASLSAPCRIQSCDAC